MEGLPGDWTGGCEMESGVSRCLTWLDVQGKTEAWGRQAWRGKEGGSEVFYFGHTGCEMLLENAHWRPGQFPEERTLLLGDPECGLGCPLQWAPQASCHQHACGHRPQEGAALLPHPSCSKHGKNYSLIACLPGGSQLWLSTSP